MTRLTRAAVITHLVPGLRGRAIVTARNQHLVVDAPLLLGGPNEEMNPVDLMLASLTSHAVFVCEHTARQEGVPLLSVHGTAQVDLDPLGVVGEPVYSGLQALRLKLTFSGPTEEQAQRLSDAVRKRCSIFVTLARALSIELEVVTTPVASR